MVQLANQQWRRRLGMVVVGCFFVWHATAIAVNSVADTFRDQDFTAVLSREVKPYFRPYTKLAFNQKQSWRMFVGTRSTVANYEVQQEGLDGWEQIAMLDDRHFSALERNHNLKLIKNMMKSWRQQIRERYVLSYCHTKQLPEGTTLRLRKHWYSLPKDTKDMDWSQWSPTWKEKTVLSVTCPTVT